MYQLFVKFLGYLMWESSQLKKKIINLFKWRKTIGSTSIPKGHQLFLFDLSTGMVRKEDLDEGVMQDYIFGMVGEKKTRVKKHTHKFARHCRPIFALNVKNALKKARKINKLGGYGWSEKEIKFVKTDRSNGQNQGTQQGKVN